MDSILNITEFFILYWKFNSDGSFDMAIEWKKDTWLGFGFCPTVSNTIIYFQDEKL